MPATTLSIVLVHRNDYERGQLRSAFEAMPGVVIAGERDDLRAGMAMARQARPHILVLELAAPIDDVLAAASQYRLEHPDVAIFLLSEVFDPETLLRALRAGAQEVLRRPLDRGALSDAVERVSTMLAHRQGGGTLRRVITIFSSKGGIGTSTIATNLAIGIRRSTGREVALADFDYQSGDAAFMLGMSPVRSLGDIMAAAKIDSASVQDSLMKHPSGVHVLSQPEQLDRVDGVSGFHVAGVLDVLSSLFEIVVVDAPHLFNEVTLEVFDRSSTMLLVVEPSMPSVRGARRAQEILHRLNYLAVPDRVRLVINRFTEQSAIKPVQIEEALGMPVFARISNDYASVSKAINLGRPVCEDNPTSRVSRDLLALANALVPAENGNGSIETAAPQRPGLMRLFGKGKAS